MKGAEMDPAQTRFRYIGADLGAQLRQVHVEEDMAAGREDGQSSPSSGAPESGSGHRPAMIPAPDSPPLSAPMRGSTGASIPGPPLMRSAPRLELYRQAGGAQYDGLAWGRYVISVLDKVIGRRTGGGLEEAITHDGRCGKEAQCEGSDTGRWGTRSGAHAGGGILG